MTTAAAWRKNFCASCARTPSGAGWTFSPAPTIRLDVLPDPVRQRALRRTMRSDTRQQQLALASAVEQLRMANLLHNELEAVYRPCMDFAALTTFTDRYLRTFPGT